MFGKKTYKTSKPVISDPIHIGNKTLIPISYIDITILDVKNPSMYGTADSKGVIVLEEDKYQLLKVDEDYDFDEAIKGIPALVGKQLT